jgi:hypothetical protein
LFPPQPWLPSLPPSSAASGERTYESGMRTCSGVKLNVCTACKSTGRKLADSCELRAMLPEQGQGTRGSTSAITAANGSPVNPYCREVEPYLTSIRGLATYTVPRVELQISGTWRNDPGDDLAANFVATNAYIAANGTLGRNLSEASNVTVNLIEPNTFYSDRRNNIDLRIAKIVRFGRTRTQIGLDIYNLTNTDVVTDFNQTFSPTSSTWLTPTAIQPARYAKISAQIDF